ncbi:hypothetical protein AAXB25_34180 [Paenibacillus lautus]
MRRRALFKSPDRSSGVQAWNAVGISNGDDSSETYGSRQGDRLPFPLK